MSLLVSILSVINIANILLPSIARMMGTVERIMGPGAGEQKKEIVMEGAQHIIEGIASVSTGGQADTWKRLAGPISTIIDELCKILFPNEE